MGWKRTLVDFPCTRIHVQLFIGFIIISFQHFSNGTTNPDDVAAINNLYVALGSPTLPGWIPNGGDPCTEAWQGVQCDPSNNIVSISLIGANLGGGLGDNLGSFSFIKSIDFSNNNIGGSIPTSLPVSITQFFLSDNNFTGIIPDSLSSLTLISGLKLNDNNLSGELPDSFDSLTSLAILDLANNGLSGELPPSMRSLSSLTSLHLQSNQLSGTLDVLQDLPLQDLDIRDNQFNGPIPDKVLSIPNFKKDGNPFSPASSVPSPTSQPTSPSTELSPSSSATPATSSQAPPRPGTPPSSGTTTSGSPPGQREKQAAAPSGQDSSGSGSNKNRSKTTKIVGIVVGSIIGFIVLTLLLMLCLPMCFSKSKEYYRASRRHEIEPYKAPSPRPLPYDNGSSIQPNTQIQKDFVAVRKEAVAVPKEEPRMETRRIAAIPKQQSDLGLYSHRRDTLRKQDSELSMGDIDLLIPPPPPPPPPLPHPPLAEKVIVNPVTSREAQVPRPPQKAVQTSVRSFTIASLQEYTNSFSQDNLIGNGMLGNVYRAEDPSGKLLAIKKLDKGVCSRQKYHEFIELVNDIDKIRHAHVVELVGYCSEHGHRLLIYEYCGNGTLQDALHSDDEYKRRLSWNARMQMALGAARALEYLHEVCEPPIMHKNFKSGNILLDDDFSVRVSDCGLAPLIGTGSVSQLSGLLSTYGYGAPEFESGIYTPKSDVYSFGVVMLELLTGRISYDNTRPRGEQILVRWAVPQLHDIDALQRMVDPSLNGEGPAKSLSHFADIISRCVQTQPEFRPQMSEVVQDLQDILRRASPPKRSYGD